MAIDVVASLLELSRQQVTEVEDPASWRFWRDDRHAVIGVALAQDGIPCVMHPRAHSRRREAEMRTWARTRVEDRARQPGSGPRYAVGKRRVRRTPSRSRASKATALPAMTGIACACADPWMCLSRRRAHLIRAQSSVATAT